MPATSTPRQPTRIGRYRITGVIGRGGMGTVYRGHDDTLDRDVAVKVIDDRFGQSANVLRRFGEEARSVARLSSPHIVHVHEFDPFTTPPFLAMELVRGPSLQQLIRARGRAAPATVADCGRQVLSGLAAAHAAGVIHRDIKPANVLRGADGTYKLTDFGLARSLEREQSLTASGSIIGTLHYMAPEVAAGEEATAASDLYSLGVTLYEMLAGTTPFPADSPLRLLRRIATERPLPLRVHRDDIPPQLEAWLDKLLAHEPADRFASAVAALDALRQVEIPAVAADDFATAVTDGAGCDAESPTLLAPPLDAAAPEPIPRDQVDSIIRSALRLEGQGRSLMGDETILEIARELNVDSRFVRRALADHRAASAAPEPPLPASPGVSAGGRPAPLDPAARERCAVAIDSLWWAQLVSLLPAIPILDLNIGGLVSLMMARRPLGDVLARHNGAFVQAAGLVVPLIGMLLSLNVVDVLGLAFPPLILLALPIAIAVFVMWLILNWTGLSGAADLLDQAAAPAEAERVRSARNWGLWISIGFFVVGCVIASTVGVANARRGTVVEQRLVMWGLELALLPVSALLYWLFVRRPLALASRTLRGPAWAPGTRPLRALPAAGIEQAFPARHRRSPMGFVNTILGIALLFLSYLTMEGRSVGLPRSEMYGLLFLAVGVTFLALGVAESVKRMGRAGRE